MTPRKSVFLLAALIAVFTTVAFARVWTCEFINYDDPEYVTDNAIVQQGITWEGASWAFGNLHGKATYWHPLTWIAHMVDCQLFGLNPKMHHLVNLLFHTTNTVLLFLLLSQITKRLWPSAAVALLFGIHPLQVDTVAWVAERKNLLTVFFALLCLHAYGRYARTKRSRWYASALLLFAATLMCKPALVILPAVLLLLDHWPLDRLPLANRPSEPPRGLTLWKLVAEKLPFFALSIASAAITILAHQGLGIVWTAGSFSFSHRVQNAIVSYGRYLKKVLLPTGLTVHYPHPGEWPIDLVLGVALLLVVLTVFSTIYARQKPWLLTGWFWFVGGILPASGIIQVGPQSMGERFIYFPIIGLGIASIWTITELWERYQFNRRLGTIAMALVFLGFAGLTVRQIGFWQNSRKLWERCLAVTSNNYIAENNLSDALLQMNKPEAALPHSQRAVAINATAAIPRGQLGHVYRALGNRPAAITNYQIAADLDPNWLDMPLLLAQAYESTSNIAAAIGQYHRALAIDPDSTIALNNLAWIIATQSDARLRNGPEAVRLARRASQLKHEPIYLGTLAAAYAENGQFDEAVRMAGRAAERARALRDEKLAQRNLELQQLYAQHRAYHQR